MYVPPAFKEGDVESIRATIHAARLANLITHPLKARLQRHYRFF
jgi:predicted FMN-binding regulatory protein PaiB